MKKLLVMLATLLFVVPLANATDLYVFNLTGRNIRVAIAGSEIFPNSLNAWEIKGSTKDGKIVEGKARFFNWGWMPGPLRFAFSDDMKKLKYNFFETYETNGPEHQELIKKYNSAVAKYNESKKPKDKLAMEKIAKKKHDWEIKHLPGTFPIWMGGVKGIAIKMSDNASDSYRGVDGKMHRLPIVRQTYPKQAWLTHEWPYRLMNPKQTKLKSKLQPGESEW